MDPVGKDKRWDVFGAFHDYLTKEYPSVCASLRTIQYSSCTDALFIHFRHKTLKKTNVNTWGLIYEWTGSDTSLKPILLAAHQG